MTAEWPGLGFDPAPGDPAHVGGLGRRLTDTARFLWATHEVLSAVRDQRGTWTGEASRAFAEKLGALPRYLDDAQSSLQRAGGVLRVWESWLGGLQARARDLESSAVVARTRLAEAEDVERRARAHPDFGLVGRQLPAADLPEAQRRVNAAQAELNTAIATTAGLRASLEDLLRKGVALRAEHERDAARTADGVRRADDGLAPPEPAWYAQAVAWVVENLDLIGDVAGLVSAVAGTLALVPVLAPLAAPVALVSGGVALLAHGTDMAVHDRWDDGAAWFDLGADAIGLFPGVKALGAAADGMGSAFHGAGGVGTGVVEAAEVLGREFTEAGPLYQAVADRVGPVLDAVLPGVVADRALVAKSLEGLVNVGTQVPAANGLVSGEDFERAEFAATGIGVAAAASNEWGPRLVDLVARAAR